MRMRVTQFDDGWAIEERFPYIEGNKYGYSWIRSSKQSFETKEAAETHIQQIEEERRQIEERRTASAKKATCSWLNPWGVGEVTSRLDERTGDWRR